MKPICPRGFRGGIMPGEALRRERIIRTVSDAFARRGYLPVETPFLEDRRSIERAACAEDAAFQLFDSDGGLLMARSDLTIPIARLVATRLEHASASFRLRYAAPIVRDQARFMDRSRQFRKSLSGLRRPAVETSTRTPASRAACAISSQSGARSTEGA